MLTARGHAETDQDGRYRINFPDDAVRFYKPEYEPKTVVVSGERADISLRASREAAWTPPVCSVQSGRHIGAWMRFRVPDGVRVQTGSDVDYTTATIRSGRAYLQHGAGPHWTAGLAPRRRLEAMAVVWERDVNTSLDLPAAEYRGETASGKRWRAIYQFGESIEYYDADAPAAKFFDAIMDTLCIAARPQG